MKEVKIRTLFIGVIILFHTGCQGQLPMVERFEQEYHQVIDDIRLINHCYFQKLPGCTQHERQELSQAFGRVGVRGSIMLSFLAIMISAGAAGYSFFHQNGKKYFSKPNRSVEEQFNEMLNPVRKAIEQQYEISLNEKELTISGTDIVLKSSEYTREKVTVHFDEIIHIIKNHFPCMPLQIWSEEFKGFFSPEQYSQLSKHENSEE